MASAPVCGARLWPDDIYDIYDIWTREAAVAPWSDVAFMRATASHPPSSFTRDDVRRASRRHSRLDSWPPVIHSRPMTSVCRCCSLHHREHLGLLCEKVATERDGHCRDCSEHLRLEKQTAGRL